MPAYGVRTDLDARKPELSRCGILLRSTTASLTCARAGDLSEVKGGEDSSPGLPPNEARPYAGPVLTFDRKGSSPALHPTKALSFLRWPSCTGPCRTSNCRVYRRLGAPKQHVTYRQYSAYKGGWCLQRSSTPGALVDFPPFGLEAISLPRLADHQRSTTANSELPHNVGSHGSSEWSYNIPGGPHPLVASWCPEAVTVASVPALRQVAKKRIGLTMRSSFQCPTLWTSSTEPIWRASRPSTATPSFTAGSAARWPPIPRPTRRLSQEDCRTALPWHEERKMHMPDPRRHITPGTEVFSLRHLPHDLAIHPLDPPVSRGAAFL
ncbi:hypothetical protein NUW54_g3492 [Trametes sanguinea]|uniref:Uncharacterized protein n=2 Tax=Trametes sanguinea TaxID=158606 RepID=A0ACC1Q2I0_9APHY|nr:hypothetical protein NUW54_g4279 [Trametes sanguinea]KAJ3007594.1 hypothetical protein NUW54_g3492 [Trametes sanguinea]